MVLGFYGFMALWLYGLWFYSFMVLCFMVLWLYGFMLLWFYGVMVLWFYGFLVSENYQISISCFQQDIDPISINLKIVLRGILSLSGASLFQIWSTN